jgi:hypothetical protein
VKREEPLDVRAVKGLVGIGFAFRALQERVRDRGTPATKTRKMQKQSWQFRDI